MAIRKRIAGFILLAVLPLYGQESAPAEPVVPSGMPEAAEAPVSVPVPVLSDDPVVLSYQRNFVRASISTKLELLAAAPEIPSADMTPLYLDALYFVLSSHGLLGEDRQLAEIACSAIRSAAECGNPAVLPPIQAVFPLFSDVQVQTAAIGAVASLSGPEDGGFVFLRDWFASALDACSRGTYIPPQVLNAALTAFAGLGNADVFPLVFRAATSNLDSSVVAEAEKTIISFQEGFTDNILAIVSEKDPQKTAAAFSFARKNEQLADADLGKIAEEVFRSMLELNTQGNAEAVPVLDEAMLVLTGLKWYQASPLVLQYFYRMQSDYKNGKIGAEKLIPVIDCLGAMGTNEAAQALSIFLGLLNSETEQKKTCNEQLMLSIIHALGDLGDKAAFDYLLYVGYLDYPESVKQASRDALARLKW